MATGLVSVAALAAALAATPASAQVCAYNSTQATCACPTSGGGTTCFGGQLYKASDGSCQNDTRPCSANQQFNCTTASCQCDTASYPCGGCTAATSTVGATCTSPVNGKYTSQCGACSCGSGTTLCGASNTCVTNLSCPAGTTFDPCTNSCVTPNVLLSPSWVQSGYVQISGDMKTTGGDLYLGNGKAIRVDGAGATSLNIGNWGGGTFAFNVTGDVGGSRVCVAGTCRTAWPSTTDFNPTYINTAGDTMTGDLRLSGATTDALVGGTLGVGMGTTGVPTAGYELDVIGDTRLAGGSSTKLTIRRESTATDFASLEYDTAGVSQWSLGLRNSGTNDLYLRDNVNNTTLLSVLQGSGNVGIGTTTPTSKLDVVGTVEMTGFQLTTGAGAGKVLTSDASGNGAWQTLNAISGTGTANYVPKFTAATTLGNSLVYDNGTNVGIGTTTPGYKLDVFGTGNVWTGSAGAAFSGTNTSTGSGVYARSFGGLAFYATSDAGMAAWLDAKNSAALRMDAAFATTSDAPTVLDIRRTVSGSPGSAGNGIGATISFTTGTNPSGNHMNAGSISGILTNANQGVGAGALTFATSSGGVGSEKMRIDSAGNVGVGMSSPTYKVDVSGTVHATNNAAGQIGVWGVGANSGVFGDGGSSGYGVSGISTNNNAVYGNSTNGRGVNGNSSTSYGVYGSSTSSYGVYGYTSGSAYGVYGAGPSALSGVYGTSNSGAGVTGYSSSGYGGSFSSTSNTGLAVSSGGYYGANVSTTGTFGLYASSNNTGLYGTGTYYGVAGSSNGIGVQGVSTGSYSSGGDFKANGTGGTAVSAQASGAGGYSFYGYSGKMDNYGDLNLYGKNALRGSDTWLRLNQDSQFSSGTHTPGNFNAYGGITTGANYWAPGVGNLYVGGTITSNYYAGYINANAYGNGGFSGWIGTGFSTSNTFCALNYERVDVAGRCYAQMGSYGTWEAYAQSLANGAYVDCQWLCYKYR